MSRAKPAGLTQVRSNHLIHFLALLILHLASGGPPPPLTGACPCRRPRPSSPTARQYSRAGAICWHTFCISHDVFATVLINAKLGWLSASCQLAQVCQLLSPAEVLVREKKKRKTQPPLCSLIVCAHFSRSTHTRTRCKTTAFLLTTENLETQSKFMLATWQFGSFDRSIC